MKDNLMKKLLLTLLVATNLLAFNLMDIFSENHDDYVPKRNETTKKNAELSLKYIKHTQVKDDMSDARRENAVYMINEFLSILQNNNFNDAAEKSVPLMHRSLLTSNQKDLDGDTKRFSFKKAYTNAKNYNFPIAVTRVDKLKTTEIGHGNQYDAGVEYKVWIAKKESKGYPAPIVLFFKNGSENPKISYVGSL